MTFAPKPEPVPIWHPIARVRRWRKRRARAQAVGDFSAFLMPIIKSPFPTMRVGDLADVQPIAEQMSDESVIKWNVVHRRTYWWHRLWRWASQ